MYRPAVLRAGSRRVQILVGVTGASGAVYARRLIEVLGEKAGVILSRDAETVIKFETGLSPEAFAAGAAAVYRGDDMAAPPASGSHPASALVIVPCSGTTVAKIAAGIADNLVTRAAAVALKEHRKLILVPRETPLSAVALENLLKLARLGVVILPAAPGFYGRPREVGDLVDFVVARILDHLGIEHDLGPRWTGPTDGDS
jgi:4-hydroxy-3-polyprenylbenzoate decarboxylase